MTRSNNDNLEQNTASLPTISTLASVSEIFIQQSREILFVHCKDNGEIVESNQGFRKRFRLLEDDPPGSLFSFLSFNGTNEHSFEIGLEKNKGQPALFVDNKTRGLLLFYSYQRNKEFFLFGLDKELEESRETELLSKLTTDMGNLLREENRANRKLSEAYEKIKALSQTDALTNMLNRDYFMKRSVDIINHAKRHNHSICIIMSDIDHFKKVNDKFGHQTGDTVLTLVGKILNDTTRAGDMSARYGGEEFITLLQDASLQEAGQFAERIRLAFEASCPLGPDDPITISLGAAKLSLDDSLESLIKKADDALYQAKATGRNKVCFSEI